MEFSKTLAIVSDQKKFCICHKNEFILFMGWERNSNLDFNESWPLGGNTVVKGPESCTPPPGRTWCKLLETQVKLREVRFRIRQSQDSIEHLAPGVSRFFRDLSSNEKVFTIATFQFRFLPIFYCLSGTRKKSRIGFNFPSIRSRTKTSVNSNMSWVGLWLPALEVQSSNPVEYNLLFIPTK